jgi:hypothetical protein
LTTIPALLPSSIERRGQRAFKTSRKRLFLAAHRLAIRLGLYVLPVHYYTQVPNVLELERTQDRWAQRSELPGIEIDIDKQAGTLEAVCAPFQPEYEGARAFKEATKSGFGPGYGFVESQALHGVLRHFKPKRIVEVGSGVSTYCMQHALLLNQHEGAPPVDLVSIEPYPSERLKAMQGVRLMQTPVQQVPLDVFESLGAGDLLFIDSTHAVKAGGDVNFLILEVLPRLAPGVIVHVHDVYFPYDYQRDILDTLYFWSETSLLRAFLTHNQHARILFCLSQLHYERPNLLRRLFPGYFPEHDERGLAAGETQGYFPSSLYIEIV